jgi:Tol biopolymer transport system component
MAAVVRGDPDWSALPTATPASLARILRRCLEKDPARRMRDMGDVELLLDEALDEEAPAPVGTPSTQGRNWWWPAACAALVLALAAVLVLPGGGDGIAPATPVVGELIPLTDLPGVQLDPSLSPDGRQFLYVSKDGGDSDIFLQRVGGENAIPLTADHEGEDVQPAFSPDGERIAFASDRAGGGIFVMGATGENPRRVSDEGYDPAWSPDGAKLVYTTEHVTDPSSRAGLAWLTVVDLADGGRHRLSEVDAAGPAWSPHDLRIAFWTHMAGVQGQRDLYTIPADGGEATPVLVDRFTDWDPLWSPDGRWLYFLSDRGGSPDLWRIAIDEATGRALGDPQPVTTGTTRLWQATISASGRLAVTSAWESAFLERAPYDPDAERIAGPRKVLHRSADRLWQMELSSDGRWLAFGTSEPRERLYLLRTDGSERRKLVDDEFRNRGPTVSPDGRWVAYYSNRSGFYRIWAIRSDGTGDRLVGGSFEEDVNDPSWGPQGGLFAVNYKTPCWTGQVLLPEGGLDALTEPVGMEALPATEGFAGYVWSPDHRFLVGTSETRSWALALWSADGGKLSFPRRDSRLLRTHGNDAWLDSRRLVFWDVNRQEAGLLDVTTGEVRRLPDLPGPGHYAFGDDGRTIYMNWYEPESEIWLLTLRDES